MAASTLTPLRTRRCTVVLEGCVQGVGFRPAVYRFALQHELGGSVRNTLQGVLVDVEGDEVAIARFLDNLAGFAPVTGAPSRRRSVTWEQPTGIARPFSIDTSLRDGRTELVPVPDLATCDRCLAELADRNDRRHGHAFVTCTTCGPRFTIVQSLPYDRERTTMAAFACARAVGASTRIRHDRRLTQRTSRAGDCGPARRPTRPDGSRLAEADPIDAPPTRSRAAASSRSRASGATTWRATRGRVAAVAALRRQKAAGGEAPGGHGGRPGSAARARARLGSRGALLLPRRPGRSSFSRVRAPTRVAARRSPRRRELG